MSNDSSKSKGWIIGACVAGVVVVGSALAYRSYSAEQSKKTGERKVAKAKAAAPKKAVTPKAAPAPKAASPAANSSPVSKSSETSEKAPPGELSREDLVAMFKDIVAGMDSLIFQLARRERQLRSQEADKSKVLAALSQSYQEKMQEIQFKAFEKFNTTEEIAERAVMKYENDPEFVQVRARMDLINNALMGGVPPPDPEDLAKQPAWLTVEKVIEIFTVMMETMTQSMVETVEEVSQKHTGPPPHEEVNQLYMAKISKVKDSILEQYKLDEKMLDVAMLKYANDPNLAQVMIDLQSQQEQKFKELRERVWSQ